MTTLQAPSTAPSLDTPSPTSGQQPISYTAEELALWQKTAVEFASHLSSEHQRMAVEHFELMTGKPHDPAILI